MEHLLPKTFKNLSDTVASVVDKFFIARKIQSMKEGEYLAECDYDKVTCSEYLEKVNKAFSKLNERERNLINNEFFFQSYHYWWESIYSKATFYRYKKRAMRKFLEAFYYD